MRRGNEKKLTPEQVTQLVNLYLGTNMSAREIGAQFGVSASNVVYHANKKRKEIENAETGASGS